MNTQSMKAWWPIFIAVVISASSYGAAKVTIQETKDKADITAKKVQTMEVTQREIHTDVKWIKQYLQDKK